MEGLLTRRLCRVCLRQYLSVRNRSFQASCISRVRLDSLSSFQGTSLINIYSQFIPKRTLVKSGIKQKPKPKPKEPKKESEMPWAVVVIASSMVLAYIVIRYQKNRAEKELLKSQPVPMVTLSVGGDWELENQDGKVMTNKDFFGQWVLLYFGFTHCPDICPDELEKIVKAVNIIGR